jgi:hypothetical protein
MKRNENTVLRLLALRRVPLLKSHHDTGEVVTQHERRSVGQDELELTAPKF